MHAPTLHLSLSPLALLDKCEHAQAYREDNEDGTYYLYHLCEVSCNGTEKCRFPSRLCRVKEEDELFAETIELAVTRALFQITMDNEKEEL